jgi:hypothetical protein
MTFTQYRPENSPIIVRPACPTCTAQMYLARIEPEKPGYDLRIFECPMWCTEATLSIALRTAEMTGVDNAPPPRRS